MKENKNQLEGGTYEIIRQRLDTQATELRSRLNQLNDARKEVFGAIETQLIANDRINTKNHCIARDIVAIGDRCIFGYNVHIGLRAGIQLSDVFSVYKFEGNNFQEEGLEFLNQQKFQADFKNLYRYYKSAYFARFMVEGTYLYMVFHVNKKGEDFKAFKWLIKDDKLTYVDNRSDQDVRFPDQHEFKWQRVHVINAFCATIYTRLVFPAIILTPIGYRKYLISSKFTRIGNNKHNLYQR